VRAPLVHEVFGVVTLGVQCVDRGGGSGQVDVVQKA
jgi:hypothetical protein